MAAISLFRNTNMATMTSGEKRSIIVMMMMMMMLLRILNNRIGALIHLYHSAAI